MVCDGGVFVGVFGFLAFGVVGLFGCVFVVVFCAVSVVVLVVVWWRYFLVCFCGGVLCFFCGGFGGGGGGGVVRACASPQCVRCRKAASPCRLEGGKMCADVSQIKEEGRPF